MQEIDDTAGPYDDTKPPTTPAAELPAGDDVDDDPEDLDDQAAELDEDAADPVDGEPLDANPEEQDDSSGDVTAVCRGGPYDGRTVTSRFPKGFILIDKPHGHVFIYDWAGAGFNCRTPAGEPLDEEARWRAAEEGTYDVIAVDPDHDAAEEVHP